MDQLSWFANWKTPPQVFENSPTLLARPIEEKLINSNSTIPKPPTMPITTFLGGNLVYNKLPDFQPPGSRLLGSGQS